MLADSQTEIYAARCMVLDAARRRDDGERRDARSVVLQAVRLRDVRPRRRPRACRSTAARATSPTTRIERFYRDVRLFRIYEGTTPDPAARHRAQHDPRRDVIAGAARDRRSRPHRRHSRGIGPRERPTPSRCVDGERRVTLARARGRAIDACAAMLAEAGVRAGDRVLIVAENCVAQLVALLSRRARSTPARCIVNARLSPRELDAIRDHAQPRGVVLRDRMSADEVAAHAARHRRVDRRRWMSCVRLRLRTLRPEARRERRSAATSPRSSTPPARRAVRRA